MPLREEDLGESQNRVNRLVVDTIDIVTLIGENADTLFPNRADEVRAAIEEYLQDFIRNPRAAGQEHPETLIYRATRDQFQAAGLYGAQLSLKEQQVSRASDDLRRSISTRSLRAFRRPFKKWVDIVNNFLGSVVSATGLSEALKELKDCLRDEVPEDD